MSDEERRGQYVMKDGEIHVGWGEISPEGTKLPPGARYRVTWEDCCTEGGFTAALVRVNYSAEPDSAGSVDSLTFDNGVTCDGVTLVRA